MSPHLPTKSQSDRKKKESELSKSSTKESSPTKTKPKISRSKFYTESTSWVAESSSSYTKSIPTSESHSYTTTYLTNPNQLGPQNQDNSQYAERVVSGATGLGINMPTYLERGMQDQHGSEYMYSSIQERIELESVHYNASTEPGHWEAEYEYLHGDLRGIGAQFEGQLVDFNSPRK